MCMYVFLYIYTFLCMVSRAAFGSQGHGSIEEAAGPGALEGGNMQKANFGQAGI